MKNFKKTSSILIMVLVLFVGGGSAFAANGPAAAGTQKDESVVDNPSQPKNGVKEYVLREELSVGNDTDEHYTFGRIKRVHVDDKLNMFVLDYRQDKVFMYDKGGKFVRTFGKKGEGPGEQILSNFIALDKKNEMVHILDLRIGKISLYFMDGRFDRDIKLNGFKPGKIYLVPNGFYILNDSHVNHDGTGGVDIARLSLDGQPIGQKLTLPGQSAKSVNVGGTTLTIKHPLMYNSHFVHDQDGNTYYGYSSKYEITVYNPDLKKVKVIKKEAPDVPVSAEDETAILEQYREALKKKGIKITKNMLQFDKYYQKFYGLWVDDRERLLVHTQIKENMAYVDIFNQSGIYTEKWIINSDAKGTSMDAIFANPLFKGNCIYTTVQDEEGLIMIKKYRLIEKKT